MEPTPNPEASPKRRPTADTDDAPSPPPHRRRVAQSANSGHLVDTYTSGRGFLIKRVLPEALRKKPSHQEGSPGGPSCIVFGFLPRRPSEEHAVGQLDIQSQPYEGLNSNAWREYTRTSNTPLQEVAVRGSEPTPTPRRARTTPPSRQTKSHLPIYWGPRGPTSPPLLGANGPWLRGGAR